MLLAIVSDIHDNVWKLASALDAMARADALLCCGDLCSPFIVHQMARAFPRPIHIVFGNNDGDRFRIAANARKHEHVSVHGEFYAGEFGGRKFAVQHFDHMGREIARGGAFDVVCYGHNHAYEVAPYGRTLAINPGALMGAAFTADGKRSDIASTFVLYDTASGEAARCEV